MSSPDRSLAERVARVYLAQRTLGCETTRRPGLTVARNRETPLIWDANFAYEIAAPLAHDPAALGAALDEAFADASHRKVVCDVDTAPGVEAALVALGFGVEQIVQLVLETELAHPTPMPEGVTIEAAESEPDWAALVDLQHANFTEKAEGGARPPMERVVAEQMVRSWRMKRAMRFWLARAEGVPCAYLGSWVGEAGLGMVESLFTEPGARHRGIARALIGRAVAEVRAEGAEAVLIGADIEDTPKQMYLDLGFRPVCLTREWLRLPDAD